MANGLELLELSGIPKSPELSLVAESAGHAAARIKLFRLAFGAPADGQIIAGASVAEILATIYGPGRLVVDWQATREYPRPLVRAALLALLCAEDAVTAGGRLTVSEARGGWTIQAAADRLSPDPDLWGILQGTSAPDQMTPAAVQFLLLPVALKAINLNCTTEISKNTVKIRF